MSKRQSYHEKLDRVLNVFLNGNEEEVDLAEKTLEDGTVISYDNLDVGTPVNVIVEGEDPQPLADGEYKISDTEILVVVDGLISEVKAVEVVVEEETEVEAETETEVEAEEETKVEAEEETTTEDYFNMDILKEKIDLEKEGFHTITFSVANGKIEWGNLYSESFTELKSELEDAKKQIEDQKVKFEEDLKILGETVKEVEVIQSPEHTKTVPKSPKERKIEMIMERRKEKQLY